VTCSTEEAIATHDEVEHRAAANRAVLVSALGLALAGLIELGLALFTRSVGLLGDALHNLSDVSTSALVFIGFRVSKKSPSRRFPFGYDRAEDIAGLGIALVIWASAAFAGIASYRKLVNHGTTDHLAIGMIGALVGMAANQLVARYKGRVGRRIQSATLIADAHHSWLDAISSLGALVGLVAVAAGYSWGDPVAGFAVTLFIAHVGYEVTSEIVERLMDGVDPDVLQQAEVAALSVHGVLGASARARWTGRQLRVEIAATLPADTLLSDATHTGVHIERAIHEAMPEVRAVQVLTTTTASAA
jgi:cation diffusion facilitator family transporter